VIVNLYENLQTLKISGFNAGKVEAVVAALAQVESH
jgi:hypothetical protein